ncbi:MAG TPA: hypothetical protein VNK04_09700 [Gemmataceae bacterium]|jgi:hypothetical protein|nr:hypothetical protein [Gemmataceae bacterium]
MAAILRRGAWIGLVVAALGLTGCNLLALPFFIFGPEPAVPAGMKRVASDDKRKVVKVLILTHNTGLEMKPEFVRADRELTERVRAHLKAGFEYNKENVVIASPRRVEEFKNENPDWHTMDFEEIGKQFGADYVFYLEIRSLTLYEPRSANTLYRGRAEITVSLIDVNHPDEGPLRREFVCQFPSETRHAIPVEDISLEKFRDAFLNYVAKRLSWYLTSHPTREEHDCE